MKKFVLVLLAVIAFIGIAAYVSLSNSRQRDNDEKLAAMQKQLAELANRNTSATQQALIIGSAASQTAPTLEKQKISREVIIEGFNLLDRHTVKDAQAAEAIFREGIEKVDAKNPQFYNGLGRALLVSGKYEESISAFENGLAIDNTISDMQSGIGWARWNQKDYYEARVAWEKALKINPKTLDSWTALAWIYLAIGERELAVQGFNILLASPGGNQNKNWNTGMTMARASNFNPDAVRPLFPLPADMSVLKAPPSTAPATKR